MNGKCGPEYLLALGILICQTFRKKRQQANSCDAPLTSTPTNTISATAVGVFILRSFNRGNFAIATALSLSQNRASRVGGPATPPHAGCSPMHRSTAVALLRAGCKQSDRPAARITIGRIGSAVHRIIYGFNIAGFTSALRLINGSITDVAALRICAISRH